MQRVYLKQKVTIDNQNFIFFACFRYVPAGINCPGTVYGLGPSKMLANRAARIYAANVGDDECDKYVGHCETKQFIK